MKFNYVSFTLLALLFASATFAQDCNFKENTTDKFSGKRHRISEKTVIAKHIKDKSGLKISEFYFVASQEDEAYTLQLGFKTSGTPIMINTGDKLILLLDSKDKITLAANTYMPSMKGGGVSKIDYSFQFAIPAEDLAKLKTNKITDIRIAATINPMDITVEADAATDIQSLARCMLSQ